MQLAPMRSTSARALLAAILTLSTLLFSIGLAAAATANGAPVAAKSTKPALVITATKATQVSKTAVKTVVKVKLAMPKAGKARVVAVKLNPAGSVKATGKTVTKKIRVKWSKKGYYTGKVAFKTKATGKITAAAKVGSATYKTTKSVAKPSSTVSSMGANVTTTANKKFTRTVTVKPAFGRKVVVQHKVGSTWTTIATHKAKNAKSAKIKVALAAPAAGKSAQYRVRVTATKQAKARSSKTFTVASRVPAAKPPAPKPPVSQPPVSEPPAPTPPVTNPPKPPVVDPPAPPTPANIWATRPSYSTVLDRMTINPNCGVTWWCMGVDPDLERDWGITDVTPIVPTGKVASGWHTLLMPDYLEQLNNYRVSKGRDAVRPMPTQSTVAGYTAKGQGGHAQQWALQMAKDGKVYHSDKNAPDNYWNTVAPHPKGYEWSCGENAGGGGSEISSGLTEGIIGFWTTSSPHNAALLSDGAQYVGYGAVISPGGSTYYIHQGCSLYFPSGHPDIRPGAGGTRVPIDRHGVFENGAWRNYS